MQNYVVMLLGLMAIHLSAQVKVDKEFIFDQSIQEEYLNSYEAIVAVMSEYYEGVEYANADKLGQCFHEMWQMRDNDGTANKFIHIEDKPTFIKRVAEHGNYEGYASQRKMGAIEVLHNQLAFVRIDKAPTKSATLFFLANFDGDWKIIDKLWVYQEEKYNSLPSDELLLCLKNGIDENNSDKGFNSKVFSSEGLKTSKTSQLIADKTKLVSILGVYGRLVVARTDYPVLKTTAYMVLFRLNDGWKVACERISKG